MPPTQIDEYRHEIEARTAAGESCETTAAALRANGFEVSAKTISRWRVAWGLRKRKAGTVGRKYPDRKRKDQNVHHESKMGKIRAQEHRKAEITERTARGETAEQIAAALQDQGFVLKSGASAIWRLQTTWGLIPFDKDRSRGRGKWDKKKQQARQQEERDASLSMPNEPRRRNRTRSIPPKLAPSNPSEHLHYPAGLSNGPSTRSFQTQPPSYVFDAPTDHAHSDSEREPMPMMPSDEAAAPPVNVAAELMSAELLADLATSTLAAANRVKELYLAQQMNRPVAGSTTGRPPTEEDIITAKRKVREAAAVMHDLAMPSAQDT